MLYEVGSVRRKHLAPCCSAVRGLVQPEAGRGEDGRAGGGARCARVQNEFRDARATIWCVENGATQLRPGAAAIRGAKHAAAVVVLQRKVHLSRAGVDDARCDGIHRQCAHGERAFRVREWRPIPTAVHRFPNAPLGGPRVDGVRVRRVDRDGRHATGRLVEIRNSARAKGRPARSARCHPNALRLDCGRPARLIAGPRQLQRMRRNPLERICALPVEIVEPLQRIFRLRPALGGQQAGRHGKDGETAHVRRQP